MSLGESSVGKRARCVSPRDRDTEKKCGNEIRFSDLASASNRYDRDRECGKLRARALRESAASNATRLRDRLISVGKTIFGSRAIAANRATNVPFVDCHSTRTRSRARGVAWTRRRRKVTFRASDARALTLAAAAHRDDEYLRNANYGAYDTYE